MTNHENFLTKFKGEFWNHCMQNNIFEQKHLNNIPEVTKVIDNIVSNYQSHIFQNDNPQSIYPKLTQELKLQLASLHANTSQELKNMNLDQFQQSLELKQQEFNSMMKKEQPQAVNFEKLEDEPLSNDKLDELIAQQMKEREHLVQDHSQKNMNQVSPVNGESNNAINVNNPLSNIQEENSVISHKQIPKLPSPQENTSSIFSVPVNNNESNKELKDKIDALMKKLDEIQEFQKKQNIVMNKMITSQISILEKLK
jgi:hypothetical protein